MNNYNNPPECSSKRERARLSCYEEYERTKRKMASLRRRYEKSLRNRASQRDAKDQAQLVAEGVEPNPGPYAVHPIRVCEKKIANGNHDPKIGCHDDCPLSRRQACYATTHGTMTVDGEEIVKPCSFEYATFPGRLYQPICVHNKFTEGVSLSMAGLRMGDDHAKPANPEPSAPPADEEAPPPAPKLSIEKATVALERKPKLTIMRSTPAPKSPATGRPISQSAPLNSPLPVPQPPGTAGSHIVPILPEEGNTPNPPTGPTNPGGNEPPLGPQPVPPAGPPTPNGTNPPPGPPPGPAGGDPAGPQPARPDGITDVHLPERPSISGLRLDPSQLAKSLVFTKQLFLGNFIAAYFMFCIGLAISGFVDFSFLGSYHKYLEMGIGLLGYGGIAEIIRGMCVGPLEALAYLSFMYTVSCKGSAHVFRRTSRIVVPAYDPRPADRRTQDLIKEPLLVETVHYLYTDHEKLLTFLACRHLICAAAAVICCPIISPVKSLPFFLQLTTRMHIYEMQIAFCFSSRLLMGISQLTSNPKREMRLAQYAYRLLSYTPARCWLRKRSFSYVPAWLDKVCSETPPDADRSIMMTNARVKLLGYMNICVPDEAHFDLLEGTLLMFSMFQTIRGLGFHVARPLEDVVGGRAYC